MSVFIDTNVLLRSVQPSHPMHAAAVRAVAGFIRDGEALVVTPQVVAEFSTDVIARLGPSKALRAAAR